MVAVAVAAPSGESLAAAFEATHHGGGAIDAAIAAILVACVNEPGVCAPGAGAFVAVATPQGRVAVHDGYVAVPGVRDTSHDPVPVEPRIQRITMGYGGGVTTLIGPGSIATPGMWPALADAHEEHGRIDWQKLVEPAARLARGGFPLGQASHTYLIHAHEAVFGHDPAVRALLHHDDGRPVELGETIVFADLAATLDVIARNGVGVLHGGWLGDAMATDLQHRGGIVTSYDLAGYRAERRRPEALALRGWQLSSNPPPAIGGQALLGTLERLGVSDPNAHVAAQRSVFECRRSGDPLRAGSTVHVSVVDSDGLACAITASAGYGSGVAPTGTGFLMNNALGELELVEDSTRLIPGERIVSNMAPTVGIGPDGQMLAIGSPGADRITSALAQVLWHMISDGHEPADAIGAPRIHVALSDGVIWAEPGLDLSSIDAGGLEKRRFESRHMYFGGVGVALRQADGTLIAAADPRRTGAAGVYPR